jgi:hypothetical protein
VHRYLDEHPHEAIMGQLGDWKKPKIIAYKCEPGPTYIIGRYETACGGCDTLSYKGSHPDIEDLVRQAALKGNVIFEGLTVSSTYTRWLGISKDFPAQFIWMFMATSEEECYRRILARSGREPKRDAKGLADYQRKHHGCIVQMNRAIEDGEKVVQVHSDDAGYKALLYILGE